MKQNISIALLACSLFTLTFCKKESAPTDTQSATKTSFSGNEAILGWQGCAEFPDFNLTVCFTDANEYRCPCDVDCIWAGSVEYQLKIQAPDLDTTVTLQPPNNPLNAPHSILLDNFKLSVDEVSPVNCQGYGVYENYKVNVMLEEQ